MEHDMESLRDGLRALSRLMEDHDRDLWRVGDPPYAKLRHIHMHLSKVSGKVAGVVEPLDHDADEAGHDDVGITGASADLMNAAADLLMHAAQLAELTGVGLDEALIERWRRNAARFGPETEFAQRLT